MTELLWYDLTNLFVRNYSVLVCINQLCNTQCKFIGSQKNPIGLLNVQCSTLWFCYSHAILMFLFQVFCLLLVKRAMSILSCAGAAAKVMVAILGWHYSSNATCLIRPRLFYVFFAVSRITVICNIIRKF